MNQYESIVLNHLKTQYAGAGLTVISDVTTYTDTVTEAGEYWYRVKANNITNGDSVGSNVIKTTNTD